MEAVRWMFFLDLPHNQPTWRGSLNLSAQSGPDLTSYLPPAPKVYYPNNYRFLSKEDYLSFRDHLERCYVRTGETNSLS